MNYELRITNSQKGFTLIELLVVVAVIGVLSSLLMANFVGIRQRARDGQRKSDLHQIQSALELYRSDNGSYPTNLATTNILQCNVALSSGTNVYMKIIPCDALNSLEYRYQYSATSTNYCLRACLENSNDAQKDATANSVAGCDFSGSGITCTTSYTLQNP